MTNEPDPGWAAVALAEADRAITATRSHTRWTARVLAAYAVATVVFFPATGLAPGAGATVAWVAFLLILAWYVRSQRVLGRHFRRLYLIATAVWTVLWVSAATLGHLAFAGRADYWIAAGLVVALPMAVAAGRAS